MRAGDILFIKGDSWLSRIITFVDKGKYSHVAIAISDTHIFEAQYGTKSHIIELPYTSYDIVRLPLTRYERVRIIALCIKLCGHPYDVWQAIGYLLKYLFKSIKIRKFNNPNYYICSEAVDLILTQLEWGAYVGSSGDIEPNELAKKLLKIPGSSLYRH